MKKYNILFLCTHNSTRSIIAEALASLDRRGKLVGFSAGSSPSGKVNPIAMKLILEMGYPLKKLRSKNWDEFSNLNSPKMDFIITVCDNAAGEVCPIWPGKPITAHWGFPDPSRVEGDDETKLNAFKDIINAISYRIDRLTSLPLDQLDSLSIQKEIKKLENL